MSNFLLGMDLGGSKIEAVVLDGSGKTVFQKRIATPASNYRAILKSMHHLLDLAESSVGRTLEVGIGTPGALSPKTGLLRNSNTVCMNNRNLLEDMITELKRPVRIENDANCFTLSEAIDGAASEVAIVFGVIIGTGTGGGLVFNKQLIKGPHAIAGEWGHNPLPWPQQFDICRECYCGKQGCIETYLSAPGFSGNVQSLIGQKLNSQDIVGRAEQGDEVFLQQMDHYYDQMARALAHVINIIDPEIIVFGGGMSNLQGIYTEVPKRLGDYVFSDYIAPRLSPPKYGDSSGVRGAAWLWS